MREIKFRVWDKRKNKGSETKTMLYDIQNRKLWPDCLDYPEVYALMQFTGLKDKNQQDIYEGDIMVWCEIPHLVDVEWIEWEKKGKPLEKHVLEVRYRDYKFFPFGGYGSYLPEEGEVIGNIYENPELL